MENLTIKKRIIITIISSIICLIICLIFKIGIYFPIGFTIGQFGFQIIDYYIRKSMLDDKTYLFQRGSGLLFLQPLTPCSLEQWEQIKTGNFEGFEYKR
jgi:hypothetical protein